MISTDHPLLLGSGSPRRREILTQLGIPLAVRPVVVDESVRAGEDSKAYLGRVVNQKLEALAKGEDLEAYGALLVADTAVIQAGHILGKPRDYEHATEMLRQLSGRSHRVLTRFAIAASDDPTRPVTERTVSTEVVFRQLSSEHIERYVATGEGRDKAGAYGIQGIGAFAVEHVQGSYSNVVGLPACQVVQALQRDGLLGPYPLTRGDPSQPGP